MYRPPDQSITAVYWYCRSAGDAYRTTDEPFCARPYLCVSTDMDVTPGTRKSNGAEVGNASPMASDAKGITKPPRHASTCRHVLWRRAMAASASA